MRGANGPRNLAAAALLCASGPILAATTATTFSVNATVVPTCTVSAAALNFGAAIPTLITANIDALTNLSATCTNGAPFTVALSTGNGVGATAAVRRMMSGAVNGVNYALYQNAARTRLWGDGTSGTSINSLTGTGALQTIPVYGRIPTGQSPAVGTYTDVITVTVTF